MNNEKWLKVQVKTAPSCDATSRNQGFYFSIFHVFHFPNQFILTCWTHIGEIFA